MAKKRRRKPPFNPWAPLSDRQLEAETNRRVGNLLNPQLDTTRRDTASKIASIQAAAKAAADILASHAGATGDAYHQATQDVAGLGGGYSQGMRDRIAAQQKTAADFAAQQGAPAGGTQGVDAAELGDTVYHGGVAIPGSSLASQGASASALENEMARMPALQGQQDVAVAAREGTQALLDLAAKRPELHDQVMDMLFKREMDKLQGRIQQQAQDTLSGQFGETVRHHVADETLSNERNRISRLKYQEQVRAHNLAITKAKSEGRQPNASLSRAYGYIVDADGNPILDKNGKHIPVNSSTTAKSKKQKTNAQYQKAVGEASSMFEDSQPGPPDQYGDPTPPDRAWRWGNALRYLMNRYGIPRARARQALITAGFKPPAKPDRSGNHGGNYGGVGGR